MSSKGGGMLDFGYDEMGDDLMIAYGKLRGTEIDIVSAFVSRKKEEHKKEGVPDVVFTVSDIYIHADKIPVVKTEADDGKSQEQIESNKIGVLVEFFNKMVYDVLLNVSGSSQLVVPFIRGMDDLKHRILKDRINSADHVRLDTISRQLILICD
ncbi:hypothetical protein KBC86_04545 [Candidatus Gracilibacteria bacterium]|nr:hypothetical protein [Candidatus Gracilibacteria bacterium]